jgi:hypothetical protein
MKNQHRVLCLLLVLAGSIAAIAQNPDPANYALHIQKANAPIQLDGILDEPAWQSADVGTNFGLQFPVDTGLSQLQTEIRMTFDDKFLYISAVCFQPKSSVTVQSLKRDFPNGSSDVLNLLFDPFQDGLNGFAFGINPYNVQREALIDNGTTLSYDWDNKWYSEVTLSDDRWVAEVAIPFKTLRYKVTAGQNQWKMNFVRVRLQEWEVSSWYPTKLQFAANNLAFTGSLIWDDAPPKPGANISLLPYVNASHGINYQRNPADLSLDRSVSDTKMSLGGDAKIAVTPSLNLDLTFNPDFSQVEVDRQVTNLSRFELFFPERRQFFLENRDLFAMFGFPSTRPFFSRRIGLARNPVTGTNQTVPILAGARLSGKLNQNWRIGLLNMQTQQMDWDSTRALPGTNYSVATLQRRVFERSVISGIFVNQENLINKLNESQKEGLEPYHRVAGLEYNLYSKDNRWEGEWYYHRSMSPDPKKVGQTLAQFLGYRDRKFNARLGYMFIDSSYTADAGFVPRNGTQSFFPGAEINFYPENQKLNSWSIGVSGDHVLNLEGKEMDREVALYLNGTFKNQSYVEVGITNSYTFLFSEFDPTNLYAPGTQPLPGNQGYTYSGAFVGYNSSSSNNWQFALDAGFGQYFNGQGANITMDMAYRLQPIGLFTVSANYITIQLPEPYASAKFWLIGPRAEISFSRSVFASAFFQYNTQVNNFNINTRLQWRFAPASDLFLVYTDNSFAEPVDNTTVRFLSPKNRAFVLKAVYWLNL